MSRRFTGLVRISRVTGNDSRSLALPATNSQSPQAAGALPQDDGQSDALRQRGSLTVSFANAATGAWRAEPRTTRGGQPCYSAVAIMTALTLRAVFRLALRQTEGLIGSLIRLLGLDLAVPDHSTLSRRAETLQVIPRLRSGIGPVRLLVDSTGLKLCGPGEWLVEKHGTRTRRSWRKLHIGVDADTGQITAMELTTNDIDDGSRVGSMLDQVEYPICFVYR